MKTIANLLRRVANWLDPMPKEIVVNLNKGEFEALKNAVSKIDRTHSHRTFITGTRDNPTLTIHHWN